MVSCFQSAEPASGAVSGERVGSAGSGGRRRQSTCDDDTTTSTTATGPSPVVAGAYDATAAADISPAAVVPRRRRLVKPAFHDTDVDTDADILASMLADTSDTRDFPCKLNGEVARHADILATILARMSVSVSWNVAYRPVKMTGDWRGTAAINGSSRSSGDVQCVVVGLLAVVAAAVNTILFYSERHFAATEINARQQRRKLFAEERSVAWPQESLPIRCAAVCINNGRALCVDYTVKTSVYPRILWRVFHILTQPVPHTFVFIRKRKEY